MFKRRKPDESPTGGPPQGSQAVRLEGARPAGASPARPYDNSLGVPPFRPALPSGLSPVLSKENATVGRAPLFPTPVPAAPPAPNPAPSPSTAVRLPVRVNRDPADRRTLIVGRGISLQGTVQDAERLVVEGTIEATMINAAELIVSHGGMFKGEVEVEDAEIAGTVDGTLTARGNLVLRATGRLLGTARCRRLQVEDGGQISGRMEMINEPVKVLADPAAE